MRARDIMTGSLITGSPQLPVADAARLMRDQNTGDILITDSGRLVGIMTDRDIAVRVAATAVDSHQVPVRRYMTRRVVTGHPNWDLDRVAKTMGKHQVRRLPIVDRGMLVGIITLGDIALRNSHSAHVAESLREISEPDGVHRRRRPGRGRTATTVALGLLTGAIVALTLSPKQLGGVWAQIQDGPIGDGIRNAFQQARARYDEIAG